MWLSSCLGKATALAVAAAVALLASPALADIEGGQSTFITPDKQLTFGFTVPFTNQSRNDIYFTIHASESLTWASVGLGSHNMKGALCLTVYPSSDGKAVTISPRPSKAWIEPAYDDSIHIETLESKIQDGIMMFSGRCSNCRSWSGGYLDVTSKTVSGIYATGPKGNLKSDDKDASIRYHQTYGAFLINLQDAVNVGNAPFIDGDTQTFGAELYGDDNETGKRDWKSTLHAVAGIFTFIGLMQLGVVVLRVGNSVKWHWINQTLSLLGVIIATGLGIIDSFYYQRSRKFNSAHQIIGLMVAAFVIGQWALGFLHHRAFKRTGATTKMAPIHIWLGRLVILLGSLNAFFGFAFALTPSRNWILLGLVLVVNTAILALLFSKGLLSRLAGSNVLSRVLGKKTAPEPPRGYNPEPWRETPTAADRSSGTPYGDATSPNAAYGGSGGQSVGLANMGSSEYLGHRKEGSMGNVQAPREYV